jgi:hypothetical protein
LVQRSKSSGEKFAEISQTKLDSIIVGTVSKKSAKQASDWSFEARRKFSGKSDEKYYTGRFPP